MSKVVVIGHYYVRSKCQKVKYLSDVDYYKSKGYEVKSKSSDGGIYMTKPCQAWICVELSPGVQYKQDMRIDICRLYDKKILQLKRFNIFLLDLLNGTLELRWNEDHLDIIPLKKMGAK